MKNLVDYVNTNIDYINEAKSAPINETDFLKLQQWFEDNVKYFQIIPNKGNFCVYFPDRETYLNMDWSQPNRRSGMNNIPHLTVSIPPRLNGGFAITLYKIGRWAASEFPSPKNPTKSDGSPKYETVDDVIAMFDKNIINGKWKNDLAIELK